tara:strand:+ start:6826 stop:7782 length:957 start_codon:yes stop_codon:yes gene_type:complete
MQTRTYGELFKLASALIGTGGELSTGEQNQLSHFINRRFSEIFNASPSWPRYITVGEPRNVEVNQIVSTAGGDVYVTNAGTPTGGTTWDGLYRRNGDSSGYPKYSKYSDIVNGRTVYDITYDGNEWTMYDNVFGQNPTLQYTVETTPGDPPPSTGWQGQVPGTTDNMFLYDLGNIGEFVRIHNTQPLFNRSAREYEFYVTFSGAHILNLDPPQGGVGQVDGDDVLTTVWVTYKKEFTPYTITADYYTSTLEVPAEFFNFISHAVYADFLRVQNKQEEALAEEQAAQTFLALELEKIDLRSNNNTINKKFSTYVNRQAR